MEKLVYKYLKKYYIHMSDKFNILLECKTEDAILLSFNKLWKSEHGGIFRLDEPFSPPEILPYKKDDKIIVTDTGSKSKIFHKNYITTLNKLLLENKNGIINLDFSNNYGGKPQVMIAGLLPIFNNYNISVLSYYYDKYNKKHYDVKRNNNKIICISNNNAFSIGSNKKCKITELNIYYNIYTTSSAEQSIICLLSLSNYIKINLFGKKSAGYTTVNKYIQLSDKYGIEIPIGYMGSINKIYQNGLN